MIPNITSLPIDDIILLTQKIFILISAGFDIPLLGTSIVNTVNRTTMITGSKSLHQNLLYSNQSCDEFDKLYIHYMAFTINIDLKNSISIHFSPVFEVILKSFVYI